jgi:phosphatidylserine/phosphatidylglycerophosphate/cardiolipin synthase-like enzyme
MARVRVRPYLSPTLVLLAMDWTEGGRRRDFLGFAIRRAPGLDGERSTFLPNRIDFNGAVIPDAPSDRAPIQKFLWWDARIDDRNRGREFSYAVAPVVGTPTSHRLLESAGATVRVRLPRSVEHGIGTHFNRAVVSSQAFVRRFGHRVSDARLVEALTWLANGMQEVIPGFIGASAELEGAIYHLSDRRWIIPALARHGMPTSLVFDSHPTAKKPDPTNDYAVAALQGKVAFSPRTRTNIMHDKFLVRVRNGAPVSVLMGSANFTPEALSVQANLIHTFDDPVLAGLYLDRKHLLQGDPSVAATAAVAGWSPELAVGDATVRVFFPPEPAHHRTSIDAIVESVKAAKSSAFFCVFDPTDQPLLDAFRALPRQGKVMMGLVNALPKASSREGTDTGFGTVQVHRHDFPRPLIVDYNRFEPGTTPPGFWWETSVIPQLQEAFPVHIHHKFVLVDPDTDRPTIYTGSANLSGNSTNHNDENLLEITGSPRLAAIYLAEFLRLFEHYRARARPQARPGAARSGSGPQTSHRPVEVGSAESITHVPAVGFRLAPDARWARRFYRSGTPEYRSRLAFAARPKG